MKGGAWWATVYGVAKTQTQLSSHTQQSLVHLTDSERFEDIARLLLSHFRRVRLSETP